MTKQEMQELIELVVETTLKTLESKQLIQNKPVEIKSAYQKTEALLYNYNGFQRIIKEKLQEIEEIKQYGTPHKSKSILEYVPHSNTIHGVESEEESVEDAIRTVQESVQGTVQAIALIDKCMASLSKDPYYKILEMRYFECRTQEDIAVELKCSQVNISKNKSRLVKELSMRLFPNQVMKELME